MGIYDHDELGSVQIHKRVLAEIAYSTLSEIEGVNSIEMDAKGIIMSLFGQGNFPGIDVYIDKNDEIFLNIKIRVRLGMHVPDIAKQVQQKVREAIERTVDVQLREINVNVYGIERGIK